MMVFLVLELMPEDEEVLLSPERAAVPVDTVAPVVVDEETEVVRLPDTVMTELMRLTLVYEDVEVVKVDELDFESDVDVVFALEVVFAAALELLEEDGGVEVDEAGVELGWVVEEGVLLGVLLGLADDEVWEEVVEDGVEDACVDEGVLLVDDAAASTFEELELLAVSDTALLPPLSCLPKMLASNQLACAMARKMVMTANSRNCCRENIVDGVVLKVGRRRECGVPSYLR